MTHSTDEELHEQDGILFFNSTSIWSYSGKPSFLKQNQRILEWYFSGMLDGKVYFIYREFGLWHHTESIRTKDFQRSQNTDEAQEVLGPVHGEVDRESF